MTSSTRLRWCAAIIIVSAMYAVLIVKNPQVASAISSGYVAGLLTVFILVNVWKKP